MNRQTVHPVFRYAVLFAVFLGMTLYYLHQLNPVPLAQFAEFAANTIAAALRPYGQALRETMLQVPMWAAKGLFLLYYTAILVWVLLKDKSQVQGEIPGRKKPFDVRPLVVTSLGALIAVYIIF